MSLVAPRGHLRTAEFGHEWTVADDGSLADWQIEAERIKGKNRYKAVRHFGGSRLGCDVSIFLIHTRNGRIRAQNPAHTAVPAVVAQIDRIAARTAEY